MRPDPGRTAGAADCSAMLVDLHAALRSYPGRLPVFGGHDIRWGLEALDGAGDVLSDPEVARLRAAAERLRPFMEAPGHVQPLHGDAHPGNVIATREGLVWIDFEDACLGPVEWDLAALGDEVLGFFPDAELAIVPGTSHGLLVEKPMLCNLMIVDFLTSDPVRTMAPIRRRDDGR